jgi:nitrite reductase (NAD(P)H)
MRCVSSEKILKLDAKHREYDVVVIGEEPHLAYNRVGLTSFFQHRKVENLYLNPHSWVSLSINCMKHAILRCSATRLLTQRSAVSTPASPKAL